MLRLSGKRWHFSCFWAIVSAVLFLAVGQLAFVHSIELKTLDFRFRTFPSPKMARTDIVMIVIDEESVQKLQSILGRWPWPRDAYALMLDYLRAGGVRTVAFDILFAEPHLEKPEADRAFAEAIAKAGNVYLAAAFHRQSIGDGTAGAPAGWLDQQAVRLPRRVLRSEGVTLPLAELLAAAKGIGAITIDPDEDGILRRVPTTGGYIFITRGALRQMRDEAELAGVLAHEIAHVNLRHVLSEIENRYFLRKAGETASQAVGAYGGSGAQTTMAALQAGGPMFSQIADFATEVIFRGYGRGQEIEADKLGVEYAYRAGYHPEGLVSFLESSLARSQRNEQAVSTGLMRTHPIHAERIGELRAHVRKTLAEFDRLPRLADRYTQWTQGR
jgi:Zn-dependent protease with chaperone function